MSTEQKISGTRAIYLMREVSKANRFFAIEFYTYNKTQQKCNGLRRINKAKLRNSLIKGQFKTNSDHYLTFYDLEEEQPKICWKWLIVAIKLPSNEWTKVDWFN